MNENYTISISKDGAFIRSQTNWGAIRGLETFSQFVKHIGINHFSVNWVLIEDSPRFQYRGLFIDTSVHYIPVDILYENLEAMSYNKLNVFHWHIVDDHSFPYVSQIYPNLSSRGAFDAETHVYTAHDIKNIVEYARERGIRVLIELDTPSHTLSWGWSQTHLLTQCYTDGQPNGQYGPIDPTKAQNYKFIQNLFTEVIQLFPDEYFILGGDQVNHPCWESNPAINNFMNSNQITSTGQLEDYYFRNIFPIIEKFKKIPVVSSELFDSEVNLKPNTIIDVYKGYLLVEEERDKIWCSELDNITKSNHKTILSSCWYLSPNCSFGPDWKQYYECEPHSFSGTEQQNKLVLGGETWAEFVDANNIISRLWPQAIAMAERLWSPKGYDNYIEAIDRFNSQQCLMQLRGLRVSLNNGHGFCKCDYAL